MSSSASRDDEAADEYDCISPNPDVFSYFTLASVSENKRHGRFTVDACMSYTLVFMVLFIQSVLLFCVSNKVIAKSMNWQNGVISSGRNYNLVGKKPVACNDASSLCTYIDGVMSCAPPTLQLIRRWDELDLDQDGTWTRDEAYKAKDTIKCKFAVDPVEIFDVLIALLQERRKHVWLHSNIKRGTAIAKVYFTYIMGDVAMCGYRNGDMCGNLVKRGVFDAALESGAVPRVGTSVQSALEYCHQLLDVGGICERFLPSSYATWKIESVQECRDPEFNQFVYKSPRTGHAKSLLEVDYVARQRYEVAKTPIFMTYKICIVFLWILLIISQLREVAKTMSWVLRVQLAKTGLPQDLPIRDTLTYSRQKSHLRNEEIHESITWKHCIAMSVVTLLRIFMLLWLCYVGLTFLGTQTDYIGLLLDGIALLFIIEVEEIVYARVLRQDVRSQWEERTPIDMERVGVGFLARRPDVTDVVWLLAVVFLAITFQVFYNYAIVDPIYDALQCACLSQGEACYEAHTFSKSFWDHYWTHDIPESRHAINEVMAGLPLNDIARGPMASPALAARALPYDLLQHVGRVTSDHVQRSLHLHP